MTCETNQEFAANADLKVNGEKVELNEFVQSFISQTLVAMVKSLRGIGDIETIELRISKNCQVR